VRGRKREKERQRERKREIERKPVSERERERENKRARARERESERESARARERERERESARARERPYPRQCARSAWSRESCRSEAGPACVTGFDDQNREWLRGQVDGSKAHANAGHGFRGTRNPKPQTLTQKPKTPKP